MSSLGCGRFRRSSQGSGETSAPGPPDLNDTIVGRVKVLSKYDGRAAPEMFHRPCPNPTFMILWTYRLVIETLKPVGGGWKKSGGSSLSLLPADSRKFEGGDELPHKSGLTQILEAVSQKREEGKLTPVEPLDPHKGQQPQQVSGSDIESLLDTQTETITTALSQLLSTGRPTSQEPDQQPSPLPSVLVAENSLKLEDITKALLPRFDAILDKLSEPKHSHDDNNGGNLSPVTSNGNGSNQQQLLPPAPMPEAQRSSNVGFKIHRGALCCGTDVVEPIPMALVGGGGVSGVTLTGRDDITPLPLPIDDTKVSA